ncbi:MAG: Hsp70 family protein [Candidatus Hodarchaeota archaeon]
MSWLRKLLRLRFLLPARRLSHYVGIDFGTTKTAVGYRAYQEERGTQVLLFGSGEGHFRSTVRFERLSPDSKVLRPIVGEDLEKEALDRVREPQVMKERGIVPRSKLHLGQRDFAVEEYPPALLRLFRDTGLRPEHVAACVLSHAYREAESQLGRISSATITVPASWNPEQRRATKLAALVAGISDVELIDEPVAALMWLLRDEAIEGVRHIMVIDFGGGTCDIALVAVGKDKHIKLLGANAENRLGGELIDDLLFEQFEEHLFSTRGERLNEFQAADVRRQVEQFKIRINEQIKKLPKKRSYRDVITIGGETGFLEWELSVDKFKELLNAPRPELEADGKPRSVIDALRSLIQGMGAFLPGATLSHVGRVYLVGGSSHLYFVPTVVSEVFQKDKNDRSFIAPVDSPGRVVVLGATFHQFRRMMGSRMFTSRLPYDIAFQIEEKESLVLVDEGTPLSSKVLRRSQGPVRPKEDIQQDTPLVFDIAAKGPTIRDKGQRILKEVQHDKPITSKHRIDTQARVTIDGLVSLKAAITNAKIRLHVLEDYPIEPNEGLADYLSKVKAILPSLFSSPAEEG